MTQMPFMTPPGFVSGARPQADSAHAHWFVFSRDRMMVELGPPSAAPTDDPRVAERPSWARLPAASRETLEQMSPERVVYLGALEGAACWAVELAEGAATLPGASWTSLRALFSVLDDAHFAIAGRAQQLLDWDRCHRHCGRCGTLTEPKREEHARACPSCGLVAYPRIAPAVMAIVRRGREVLLARGPHFPRGMHSALAGFVEPGETLEQCVVREVEEEVGVRVANVRYFASQPWPFPHSLMIAFVCDWQGGELRPQAGEIEEAGWFDVERLPRLPSRISIARRLIDHVVAEIRLGSDPNREATAPAGV